MELVVYVVNILTVKLSVIGISNNHILPTLLKPPSSKECNSCLVSTTRPCASFSISLRRRSSGSLVFELSHFSTLAVSQDGKTSSVVPNGLARSIAVSTRFLVNFVCVHAHRSTRFNDGIFWKCKGGSLGSRRKHIHIIARHVDGVLGCVGYDNVLVRLGCGDFAIIVNVGNYNGRGCC